MTPPRRIAKIARYAAGVAGVWLLGLGVAGPVIEPATRRGVADRIAEALRADATIAHGSLGLVTGEIELAGLAARRDDLVGQLTLAVDEIRCDLPPLGLALIDRGCRELAIRGTRLQISSAALFRLPRPRRPPLHAARVVIDDARLELAALALAPGLGGVTIEIEHAEAGDTTFKTPLSWVFALRALRATITLPAGIALELSYAAGELRVAGGLLGSAPIAVPVAVPVAALADDPAAEVGKLVALGKDIAERVIAERAAAWLRGNGPDATGRTSSWP